MEGGAARPPLTTISASGKEGFDMLRRLLVPLALGTALLLAAVLGGSAGAAPRAAAIANLSVKDTKNAAHWSVQTNLRSGNRVYGDRAYTFTMVPAAVTGADWIQTAGNSKTFRGNPLVTFSLSSAGTVYVGLDSRVARPAWLDSSWSDAAATETASAHITYHLLKKDFAAGSVALGPQGGPGAARAMYTVAVVTGGPPPSQDFSIALSPASQTVAAGASVTYTVASAVVAGAPDTINLSADSASLPAGVTAAFSPNPITAGQSSTLTVSAASGAASATATLSVTGQGTATSHTATAGLSVSGSGGGSTTYEAESPTNTVTGG